MKMTWNNMSLSLIGSMALLLVTFMLQAGCGQDCTKYRQSIPGKQWPDPFYEAVYNNKIQSVRNMLNENRGLVSSRSENNITPLMVAASRGNKDLVTLLIDRGGDVNDEDDMGRTCLYYAILQNQVAAARLLIQKQADVNHHSVDELTPLMYAAALGREKIVKLLVTQGADLYIKGKWDTLDARWWAKKKEHDVIYRYLDSFYK